jgi:hypothetical protein
MVIGPGLLEAVCEKFDRLSAFRPPDEKAYCRCAKTADQPKNIFHAFVPSPLLLTGWMRRDGFRLHGFLSWVAGAKISPG